MLSCSRPARQALRKATSSNSVEVGGALIPHVWLRDHCRGAASRHAVTGQRTFDTASMSADIAPTHVDVRGGQLRLRWPDEHESTFSIDWLKSNYVDAAKLAPLKQANALHQFYGIERAVPAYADRRTFDRASFPRVPEDLPGLSYAELLSDPDRGLLAWLDLIVRHGFAVLRDTPATFAATEAALARIGYFENTMWGTSWQFTADQSRNDMAYSNGHLHVHNDGSYMPLAAFFQSLHCLEFSGPQRAINTFVDGAAAAERISEQSRDVLLRYLTAGRYADESTIHISHDTILKCDAFDPARIVQVRFNNEDRDVLRLSPDHTVQFYDAFLELSAAVRAPASEVAFYLAPGMLVTFDNWRTLHGRTAFLGTRHMCGAYHTLSSILGTARATRVRLGQPL